MLIRVRMRRDFLYRLIEKYFEQLIDSVWVLRPHWRNFKANDFKHYCAAACARHTCGLPQQLMNRCTKYGAIDLFTLECWHGAVSCHLSPGLTREKLLGFICWTEHLRCKISIWNSRNGIMPPNIIIGSEKVPHCLRFVIQVLLNK